MSVTSGSDGGSGGSGGSGSGAAGNGHGGAPSLTLHKGHKPPPLEVDDESPLHQRIAAIVKHKIHTHPLIPKLDTGCFLDHGEVVTQRRLADIIWLERDAKYSEKAVTVAIGNYMRTLQTAHRKKIKSRLLNAPVGNDRELRRFVALMAHSGTEDARMEYYVTALKQLVWQVKRRMRDLPTERDLMVCFCGPQGTGKSTAVGRFAKPLDTLYMGAANFDLFGDKHRIEVFSSYYLICFDEMAKAGRADVEEIKQKLSGATVQARQIYSSEEATYPRNASFISTSNHSIVDSLRDSTGMRRFVEIRCREEPFADAWGAELNGIDWAAVWACESGDEDATPSPAAVARESMARYQEELRLPSDLESFVATCVTVAVAAGDAGEGDAGSDALAAMDPIKNTTLYRAYTDFCLAQSIKPMKLSLFSRKMKDALPVKTIHNTLYYKGITLTNFAEA